MPGTVIETVGDVLDSAGLSIYAFCRRCHRSHKVDMDSVARKFGPGFSLDRVRKRLRCNRCRVWDAEIRMVHDGLPRDGARRR